MRSYMFDNHIFQNWLKTKTNEILSKVDKEAITTEEMIMLTLQAQSNHFDHMDVEFRDEFKSIHKKFEEIDKRFEHFEQKIDYRFKQVDEKFKNLQTILMWGFGLVISSLLINFFKT